MARDLMGDMPETQRPISMDCTEDLIRSPLSGVYLAELQHFPDLKLQAVLA